MARAQGSSLCFTVSSIPFGYLGGQRSFRLLEKNADLATNAQVPKRMPTVLHNVTQGSDLQGYHLHTEN